MSYGLQIRRSDGQLRLDVSDRLTRIMGIASVYVPANTPIFVTAPIASGLDWFVKVAGGPPSYMSSMTYGKTDSGVWLTSTTNAQFVVVFIGV